MDKKYTRIKSGGLMLLLLLSLLLSGGGAWAQSGPVGNEWIVPGQPYYKIKIVRDGLYRINQQYLAQAGITGVVPNELQIWRRGRQLATYVGGNRNVLDATTFLEFYAVRNDAQMDRELYKNPADQAYQYFSFYTDTASYFITWSPGTAARHMQEPVASSGTLHPHHIHNKMYTYIGAFNDHPAQELNYMPWVEPGEGFFMNNSDNSNRELTYAIDSASVNPSATGPAPRVEVLLFGGPNFATRSGGVGVPHNVQVIVVPPTGAERQIGLMSFTGLVRARQFFSFLPSDISSNGSVVIKLKSRPPVAAGDYFFVGYLRTTAPRVNAWVPTRNNRFFENDSLLAGPAAYDWSNVPATVAGFDIEDLYNVQRIASTPGASAGLSRFVFPGATANTTHQLLLTNEATALVPLPARRVRFRTINPAAPTFTIITHPLLMRPAGGVPNAVAAYAAYRASAAGGRYDTLVVTAQQLYDQFQYGDKSWIALRRFSRWLAAASPAGRQRYLLLIGKGIVPSEPVNGAYFARSGEFGLDLVPTSSRSVSDNLLTADYINNDFVAQLHTGRLTATNPGQVMNYLNKLRTHEALGPAPWRKNVLHLVGGYDANETAEFKSYLDAGKVRVERPLLGGRVATEFRITPTRQPIPIDISAQLNSGLSLITYFGHAAPSKFGLDFGAPSTSLNYTNTGKYPFLFLNGCAANATFTRAYTIVEDWLFSDQKGALGSLAEFGFSYSTQLSVAQDSMYKLLFNDPNWYGRPITAVHDESVRRLQRSIYFSDNIGIEQLLSTGWQGDPTLALYAPPKPDFIASNATLSIVPSAGAGPVKADSPEFILNVGVANPGKITYEPVEIQVTRIFPASSGLPNQVYPLIARRQAWGPDTTYALTLPNPMGAGGTSTFRVVLDPNSRVDELSETNNTAQTDFTFLQGGLSVLTPTEFAIAPATQPRLAVQSNNPLGPQRSYEFELDTVATFTSGALRRTTVTAGVVAEWTPTLPAVLGLRDSLVWYWRARFQTPAQGEDGSWANASFRVIPGSPGGWSQSHYAQFKRNARTGVDVSAPAGRWAFTPTRVPLVLRTRGGGVPRSAPLFDSLIDAGIYLQSAAGQQTVRGCGVQSPNLLIAVYNSSSLRPVDMPANFQRCGQAPDNFYYFSRADTSPADTLDNLNYSAARQQELNAFLTAVPAGSYVAVVSANRLRYSLLPTALKARLQTLLGSQLITQLADGEPLALVGQKLTATTGRLVRETGPDRSLTIASFNQVVELRDTLQRPSTSGRIVSTRIGPAKEWLNLYSTIRTTTPTGFHRLSVVAIDTLGRETVVLPNVAAAVQPLTATVNATRYPYLRLELAVADTVTRVPPQLAQWLVTSRGLPEGVVRRDLVAAADYAPATLARQAVETGFISFPVKFENTSGEPFTNPFTTRVNLRNTSLPGRPVVADTLITTAAPLPGATVTIPVRLDVKGKFGTFVTEVVVNPRLQAEQIYANNELTLDAFAVTDNNVPPTLDVAFDGRHILNGELVSSMPVINIQLNDEDRLRPITDRTVFTVTLLRPGQTALPTLVDLNGPEIGFSVDATKGSVAKLTYEPGKSGPLSDGVYTLKVQGRDPSNAAAGSQEFQVKFEVVNASQITNLYPYPNPVINKARFVFTLTGHELPRNMKIQILTLTGRVVREIFMSELGPLHIGNNITDFAWDGTDSYGDRLANGTYLYRVSLDDPNGDFKRRDSGGDKAFKNDWGKLVLMR